MKNHEHILKIRRIINEMDASIMDAKNYYDLCYSVDQLLESIDTSGKEKVVIEFFVVPYFGSPNDEISYAAETHNLYIKCNWPDRDSFIVNGREVYGGDLILILEDGSCCTACKSCILPTVSPFN